MNVAVSPADAASTSVVDFANAVYSGVDSSVSADGATTIDIQVAQTTALEVEVADSVDLSQSTNVQNLANDAATAACSFFTGTCAASVLGATASISST